MCFIYKILSPTNKVYIGQSWDIERRMKEYEKYKCKGQRKLYASLRKHGWSAHTFEIELELREDISQESLNTWEEYFMDKYRGAGFELLNLRGAGSNGRPSFETLLKMRDALKGKPKSEEHKAKLRKPRTKAQRIKISETHWDSSGNNNPACRSVLQFTKSGEFVREWGYIKEAAIFVGVSRQNIGKNALGKRKSAGGFVWKYK